jgi:exonuclease SbcC
MIFKRLLSKKKRVPGPEAQDNLAQVARSHEDPAVRRDACRRLTRLPSVREVALTDADAGVREIALAHYRHLLCGEEDNAPPVSECLEEIAVLRDERLLEHLAREARESEVRQAALLKIQDQNVLAACALHDTLAANRSAAAQRLEDKRALEVVAKNIGKKDKSVYRIARQKLKELAEREAMPARIREQCAELCEKLERLGRFESWVQDRAMLDLLDRQWAEIAPQAEAQWRDRYEQLRERFLASYEDYRREHQAEIAQAEARNVLRHERQELLDELATYTGLAQEAEIAAIKQRVTNRWESLDLLPEREQESLERKFQALLAEASSYLEKLAAQRKNNKRLRKLVASIETAVGQSKPVVEKQVRSLIAEAKGLSQAEDAESALVESFAQVRARLDERLRKQRDHAEQRIAQIDEKLNELEAAIDAGELKHAEPLYQSLAAGIELAEASGLPRKIYAASIERLSRLAPHVRDLQKWRKWGADQHRLGLCETMEELATADMPLEALALRLHDLQMEWKELDRTGSPVNHPLWERFHAVSERVYERCRPHFEEQAAEREAHRRQREEVCQALEEFLAKVDWQRVDWKKAIRAERETRQTWAAMGPVDGRARKALEKRFHNAIKRLDGRLAEERNRNQALKRDLIARVEPLASEPDLGKAMQEAKRLQGLWHTTVPARQQEENRLWQRFRAGCDAVFARRREQHEAHTAELTANLEQREAICSEAEGLIAGEADPEDLANALRELEKRWRDTEALPVPRQALGQINQRWRAARQRVERRRQERQEEQRRDALALLARQAALCERLERAQEAADTSIDPDTVEREWQALPAQRDSTLQADISARFAAAATAFRAEETTAPTLTERLTANGKRRAELCLQLEILAQVDSPADLAKERLALQVARLKEHMRDGERDPLESASQLLREWYLCGSAAASEAPELEARFERARTALERAERDTEAA